MSPSTVEVRPQLSPKWHIIPSAWQNSFNVQFEFTGLLAGSVSFPYLQRAQADIRLCHRKFIWENSIVCINFIFFDDTYCTIHNYDNYYIIILNCIYIYIIYRYVYIHTYTHTFIYVPVKQLHEYLMARV